MELIGLLLYAVLIAAAVEGFWALFGWAQPSWSSFTISTIIALIVAVLSLMFI